MATGSGTQNKTIQYVYELGTTTVPRAIDQLAEKGMDLTIVAILRKIWCKGGADFTILDHTRLARELSMSRSTVQRMLKKAREKNLIDYRRSRQKPRIRGYLCEYRINWAAVFERSGHSYRPLRHFSSEVDEWILNSVSTLPKRWFSRARFSSGQLEVTVTGGATYVLPENSDAVLKHVIENHYGSPLPDSSLRTFMQTINNELTPRLLSLLANRLHHSKTKPHSPGYYRTTLLNLFPKSQKAPSASRAKKKHAGPEKADYISVEWEDWIPEKPDFRWASR